MPPALRRLRILVYEHASGGGLAGRPVPASLGREGRAMRDALISDLGALGHQVVASVDPRFPVRRPPGTARLVPPQPLGRLLSGVDAVWLIAPETGGCLERLAARVERSGGRLLGSSAAAIRIASDKARLARLQLPSPVAAVASTLPRALEAARRLRFPVVVKPARGAGSEAVSLVRRRAQMGAAFRAARRLGTEVLVQRYEAGRAASVSLLVAGRRSAVLAVNGQRLGPGLAYRGGVTPLRHLQARRASALARAACRAVRGLRGYVGVDVVLGRGGPWLIEINPRLTTSYLGLRAAIGPQLAGWALAACAGSLPRRIAPGRSVRFAASGRILGR